MVAVAQHSLPGIQRRQRLLAVKQAAGTKVPSVEVEQVEHIKEQRVVLPARERVLQAREAGKPVGAKRDQLAVQQSRADLEPRHGARERRKPVGPVVAVAGHDADLTIRQEDQQPIAVKLDLADPVAVVGRFLGDRTELRALRGGQPAAPGPGCRGSIAGVPGTGTIGGTFGQSGWRGRGLDGKGVAAGALECIVALEQQPGVLARPSPRLRLQSHEVEPARQARAVQHEGQIALAHSLFGVGQRLPGAAVPGLHGSGAILAIRNGALEVRVVERVVLHMGRDPLVGRVERGPLAHRPTPQHAAVLQPEIPMQAGTMRRVLLHDEHRRARARRFARRSRGRGFVGHAEVALGAIRPDGRVAGAAARAHRFRFLLRARSLTQGNVARIARVPSRPFGR